MATSAECEANIQKCGWNDLRNLWERIAARQTGPEWDRGKAFEYLVLRAFQLDQAEVRWPYSVTLGGKVVEQIDGAVHVKGLSFLVESKDYDTEPVDIEPIAKLRNQIGRRPLGTLGVIFSRTDFTDPARLLLQYTSPQSILLWSGPELKYALDRERIGGLLVLKHRHCVEYAIPDFDVRSGGLI
jgi:hypothetical protein